MRKLISIFACIMVLAATAQDHEEPKAPVAWSFSMNDAKNAVELTATIDEGWHVYGLVLESDMGPLPTVFSFEEGVEWGELDVPKPIEKYDDMFMMNVTYYETQVTFTKHFTGSPDVLKGSVEFMVCNNEMCLPPTTVNFELP